MPMKYISTRNNIQPVSVTEAIITGMVPRGGLFVPEKIPAVQLTELEQWQNLSYARLAGCIFSSFLKDHFTKKEIDGITEQVYSEKNFDTTEITPLKKLNDQLFVLELFHGPTGAFKDMALQAMPFVLSASLKKQSVTKEILILVATSGDTGKAALEGFKDVPGIRVIVFYPYKKVSKIQELQMRTTEGENTHVIAVRGNFDDCQNAVKEIFSDHSFNLFLEKNGYAFSSANSINWGRLFPQIVYYFNAYLSLLRKKEISKGERINFVVPTGNFGNILAGWYAREMGLPVERLICASNTNNVLTDFFQTGIYNRNRQLIPTISPSMDILISSNLERFLFEITGHDGDLICHWMKELGETGIFKLNQSVQEKISQVILSGFASEEETFRTIKQVYNDDHYLIDPHTAVGMKVYHDSQNSLTGRNKTVVVSTASPFKFNRSVYSALSGEAVSSDENEFILLEKLSRMTGLDIPVIFRNLKDKTIRHSLVYDRNQIRQSLKDILHLDS